jgi:nitroimidazol reductase NimA-like FMN-containing flavoprotein (pyridoxamine 5'-phosphate oxidase superfamily)
MDQQLQSKVEKVLDENRVMTIATNRPDGWPQATTVGFAHEGLNLYFLCGRDSQKAKNIARDDRVSLTVDHDCGEVMEITGVSLAGHAKPVSERWQAERVLKMLTERYPPQKAALPDIPDPDDVLLCEVKPTVISLLDYSKGFGHTELVLVDE